MTGSIRWKEHNYLSFLIFVALLVGASGDCCLLCVWCWFDEPSEPDPTPRPSPRPTPRPRRPPTPRPTPRTNTNPTAPSPGAISDGATKRKVVTTFAGGKEQAGNMFDVVADKDIVIVGIDIHTSSTSEIEVMIWEKKGTFVGYESAPGAWEMIGLTKVTGEGGGRRTALPLNSFEPVKVGASERRAFYVTLTTLEKGETSLLYSSGNMLGRTYVSNDDIRVLEGAALNYPFGESWQPRVWNGALKYVLDETQADAPVARPTTKPRIPPTPRPTSSPTPIPSTVPTHSPTLSQSPTITASPTRLSSSGTFSFYLMGDIPYTKKEEAILMSHLEDIAAGQEKDDALFMVHLGDMMNARRSECVEKKYTSISSLFKEQSALPVFTTPGDNDWNDCPDPSAAWKFWSDNFIGIENHWATTSDLPSAVERQSDRPENFAFEINGVLFLGLNLVGNSPEGAISDEDWERRLDQNIEWTDSQLERYSVGKEVGDDDSAIRAVIVFGHSMRGRRVLDNLYIKLRLTDIPTLYMHANGLEFEIEQTYLNRDWQSYWSVQVDPGAIAPPVKVTIRGETRLATKKSFEKENVDQYLFGDSFGDFIKLDRNRGLSTQTQTPSTLAPAAAPSAEQSDAMPLPPAASPTNPTPIQTSSTLQIKLRLVGSEMASKEKKALERNVAAFLENLFYYSNPPVGNLVCEIQGQRLVSASRRRHLEEAYMYLQTQRKAQSDFALLVDLLVTGEFSPTSSHRAAEDVDFTLMVQAFIDVNGGQLAAMLRSLSYQADGGYFARITSIDAAAVEPNSLPIQSSSDGGKGPGKALAFAAILIGCFVFMFGAVALFFIYQKRWRGIDYDEVSSIGSMKFWSPQRTPRTVQDSPSPPPESQQCCREVMPSIDGESDGMGSLSRLELLDAPSCAYSEDGEKSGSVSAITFPHEVLGAMDGRPQSIDWRSEAFAEDDDSSRPVIT